MDKREAETLLREMQELAADHGLELSSLRHYTEGGIFTDLDLERGSAKYHLTFREERENAGD